MHNKDLLRARLRIPQIVLWQPPLDGVFKINTDASIYPSFRVGYGCGPIRSNFGTWLTGFVFNNGCYSLLQAKARALFRELRISRSMEVYNLNAESDNKLLIDVIRGMVGCYLGCLHLA